MSDLSTPQKLALGLAAGLVGTVVMTLGQKLEMALTDRPPSTTPAKAVETVTGIEPSKPDEARLSNATHFAYGTALGAGLAALDRVPEPARTLAFLAMAQGTGAAILQALDLSGKPSEWGVQDAAIDVGHHLVYAVTAGLAYQGGKTLAQRLS
ncbi:hypothetical protein [Sphingomonas jatrophae]|uniref:PEP-CTERM protein-sorting domain-containing protein n=1 Tax=Sphingomonas jatrophae TaxID=1166337 RepID=A0A1I6LAW9_9SPHN|nr:hypothetical protein [Sphingomonas jatrophae]SFS00613.1 PEP-CTERM protein-sorting domain-containing protein [Sphingomonas jatrophae]